MSMRDTKPNEMQLVAKSLADDLYDFAVKHNITKNIQYSLYYEDGAYKIKIDKDEENILHEYLERSDA